MATTIQKISAGSLTVDQTVQRMKEHGHIGRLMDEWDDDLVGALVGSLRPDGKVYLLDGQQRWSAKLGLAEPDYEFLVIVHDDLDLAGEARVFSGLNRGRKAVSAYDKYRVDVVAGVPIAVAVDEVVTSLGLSVGSQASAKTIACPATLERIVRRGKSIEDSQDILRQALEVNESVYSLSDDPWSSYVIEGLALFIETWGDHENYKRDLLEKALRSVTVTQLLGIARSRIAGNNLSGEMSRVIAERYDLRKTKNRLRAVGE